MKSFPFKIETAVLSLAFVFIFQSEYNTEITDKIRIGVEEYRVRYLFHQKIMK